ncbi:MULTISPECIES: phospholipase D family protein [unclassified Acinetobacter]|uniref:phospholipase D family protein n=1 Tax=unclassified Acinetobacter TaxID=196816 RepID=UPI0035BB1A68
MTCTSMLLLTACSTLPVREAVTPTYAYQIQTQGSYLQSLFQAEKQKHPDLTGFHVLNDANDALMTRLELIERAEKSIDLQYYIWDNDKVGALAVQALLRAADRGVKVRLLIDDNNAKEMQSAYLAMSQHPNIQVRLFNPYRFRHFRVLDIVLDFNRINRRMHNKTFIVDQQVALIGGRNMSNQYYNVGENFQFSDMDVVLVGQAVGDIVHSFDEYWNHDYAYPVAQLQKDPTRLSYASLRKQLDHHWQNSNIASTLSHPLGRGKFDQWFNEELDLEWVKAKVITDPADKISQKADETQYLSSALKQELNTPTKQIDLVSAYFVPEDKDLEIMRTLHQQGIQTRILTNSFKANDVSIVHAFYAPKRVEILKQGIELYEFLPVLPLSLTHRERMKIFGERFNREGLGRSSLHAKFLALDNQQVFIGSYNFDPRSTYLNSEIGVVLNSPKLANAIHNSMQKDIMHYAYKLELDENQRMIWKQQTEHGIEIHHTEPKMKWWQKVGLKFLGKLPLEKQM